MYRRGLGIVTVTLTLVVPILVSSILPLCFARFLKAQQHGGKYSVCNPMSRRMYNGRSYCDCIVLRPS